MNLAAAITDKANALECLAACGKAYSMWNIATEDCHVLVQEFDSFSLATFRGSAAIEDWIHDAEFDQITVAGGKVHRGIWMSYQSVSSQLRENLNRSKPVIPGGHSLGGGQATFCAWDLEAEFDINRVISFGSPAVANHQFAENYNRTLGVKTIRFVNGRDIVPRLLDADPGYVHVGQEGFLPSAGGFALNPSIWDLLRDDITGAVADIQAGKLELLADHYLESYQARIGALE